MRIEPPRPLLTPLLEPEDHVIGPERAALELVAYGDYQCPHCHAAHQNIKTILAQYRERLRFAWRHFPLSKIHPNARNAAIAAEFAGNKFWLMHDLLFLDINQLSRPQLLEYARQLNLDAAELALAFDDNRYG